MAQYVDLNTIHNPADGAAAPAAWGDQTRENFERLAKVPSVKVSRSTNFAIANQVSTVIPFTQKDYEVLPDVGAATMWDGSSALYTPFTGIWRYSANLEWAPHASIIRLFWIQVGGVVVAYNHENQGNASWYSGGSLYTELYVVGGTIAQCLGYHAAGVNLDVHNAYGLSFAMSLVSRV